MGNDSAAKEGVWGPYSAVKMRNSTPLPFSDPMKAIHTGSAQSLQEGFTEPVPVIRGRRAIPQSESESESMKKFTIRGADQGVRVNRSQKSDVATS